MAHAVATASEEERVGLTQAAVVCWALLEATVAIAFPWRRAIKKPTPEGAQPEYRSYSSYIRMTPTFTPIWTGGTAYVMARPPCGAPCRIVNDRTCSYLIRGEL